MSSFMPRELDAGKTDLVELEFGTTLTGNGWKEPFPEHGPDAPEKSAVDPEAGKQIVSQVKADIEHVPVDDDPRLWSNARKNIILFLISAASMTVGIGTAIQNPAVAEMERELPATDSQFSLSVSLFILVQGVMPIFWSAISEIKGRKLVYLLSLALSTAAGIVIALSQNIELVIGFRCIQAAGSSAILAIGAATLADIFEPHERGKKMGIYYTAPLLGPSLGPILGGSLTSGLGWRSIFWFCTISTGTCCVSFLLFFKDTFRKERSLTYQNIVKQRLKERKSWLEKTGSSNANANNELGVRSDKNDNAMPENDAIIAPIKPEDIRISIKDVTVVRPIYRVIQRWTNITMLVSSAMMFAWQIMITYTIALTLSSKYGYDAWKIGFVSLSYGIGCLFGSLVGGRWSDIVLARLKAKNGGIGQPEMRLRSTIVGIFAFPAFVLAEGWATQQHAHVAIVVLMLFGGGFFSIAVYTSILAYIVDANVGRSSSAVATNSVFRGLFAFMSVEVAVPMQDRLGDGWMYTVWAAIELCFGLFIILIHLKGAKWRQGAEKREKRQIEKCNSK